MGAVDGSVNIRNMFPQTTSLEYNQIKQLNIFFMLLIIALKVIDHQSI